MPRFELRKSNAVAQKRYRERKKASSILITPPFG
jgi:hypothetical protein